MVVVLEQYFATVVTAVLGALVVVAVMSPRARIRFAKSAICSIVEFNFGDGKGNALEANPGACHLRVRLANDTRYTLEHCSARMRCQLSKTPPSSRLPIPQIDLPLFPIEAAKAIMGSASSARPSKQKTPSSKRLVATPTSSVPTEETTKLFFSVYYFGGWFRSGALDKFLRNFCIPPVW